MPVVILVKKTRIPGPVDYDEIREKFRPGHADFTYYEKYGIRDHRGGGRSSGRETVGKSLRDAVAMKFLSERGNTVFRKGSSKSTARRVPFAVEQEIRAARDAGDSVGGIAEIHRKGVPAVPGTRCSGNWTRQLPDR
jgi:chorismate synthase